MSAMTANSSFAAPLVDAKITQLTGSPQIDGLLKNIFELSAWQIAITVLLVLVAYDQCKQQPSHMSNNV